MHAHNKTKTLIVYTMSVFDLKKGESGKIVRLKARGAVAARLAALGFSCGKVVTALSFSLFNSSILVGIGPSRVALRAAVARGIEVEKCT